MTTRTALVLGAGGPVGHAYHAGVLRALAEGCGWDARRADLVLGTSAGAHVGALLRAGQSPDELFARATQPPLRPPSSEPAAQRRWPSSTRYLTRIVRKPWEARPGRLISALLPEGERPNDYLGRPFAHLDGRWPAEPLWITAVRLDSGERAVFGHATGPAADVGTAVRSSCAVPGVLRPVEHAGERFIDGGVASPTHIDLLHGVDLGLVVVSSPLSRFAPLRLLLRGELRPLARRGVRIVALEPDAEVMRVMGWNPMNAALAPEVARAAYRRTLERSGALRALFDGVAASARAASATSAFTSR